MTSPFSRAIRHPIAALRVLVALCKGWLLKVWYPLRGIRFSAGPNLRVFGTLTVRGPGVVEFGRDVVVEMHVTAFTHDRQATIRVENHCFLNGVRFGCQQLIEIGAFSILADCRIMDTSFHSTREDRWSPDAPVTVRPVRISRNVWIAAQAGLLPGTEIGENSVVGFGAVCSGAYPPNTLIAGNPARVVRAIPTVSSE